MGFIIWIVSTNCHLFLYLIILPLGVLSEFPHQSVTQWETLSVSRLDRIWCCLLWTLVNLLSEF